MSYRSTPYTSGFAGAAGADDRVDDGGLRVAVDDAAVLVDICACGRPALALVALDEAESRFKTSLGPENQVYAVIDQMRSGLQPRVPGAEAPDKAAAQ